MSTPRHFVDIPESSSTVSVSIIDTSVRFKQWKIDPFVKAPKIAGQDYWSASSWSFKIVHPKHGTYLFDLGVRKDWEKNMTPGSRKITDQLGWKWALDKDVAQILTENGEDLDSVKAIFWSHWHWDHIGDPSTFPGSVKLFVGPGSKAELLPGWPEDPIGRANSDAWKGRQFEDVEFPTDLMIGGYRARDFFDDGSFYILDTPGHATGHICALARTTSEGESSFIFMGGDIAHMIGQIRPSKHLPLPENISPDPRKSIDQVSSCCPCAGYVAIHPHKVKNEPYYVGSEMMANIPAQAEESTRKLESFDADDRVFVVIAHDNKLEGIVDFYPKHANEWQSKNWKPLSRWRFLGDFQPADV